MLAIHKAIVLGNSPKYCRLCQNREHFQLDSNKDKEGNVYVNVICKCGAKSKLGQYKTGGYFWHQFEKYEKKAQGPQGQPEPDPTDALNNLEIDKSEVPFC